MKQNPFAQLLAFLEKLDAYTIPYTLTKVRDEALLVNIALPGERWEVEFLTDGTVEVERFHSSGAMEDERAFTELFARYGEATNGHYQQAELAAHPARP